MNSTPLSIRIGIWAWLIGAMLVGRNEVLARAPLFVIPLVIAVVTGLLVAAYLKVPALKSWLNTIDLRALVILHTTRFIGIYLLLLHNRGLLPYEFAVPGGFGDVVVAGLALLVGLLPLSSSNRIRAIRIWNVIGFVDIALVVLTASRLAIQSEPSMHLLTVLPLSLLPTFLAPLFIFTHFVIYLRLPRDPVSS